MTGREMNSSAPLLDTKDQPTPRERKGLRQLHQYLWAQYVNAFDEQQLRRISNPWVMGSAGVCVGSILLAFGYVPSLQRVTGMRHPWLVALLATCGYAITAISLLARGWLYWLHTLANSLFWVTATVLLAVWSRPPTSYTGVVAYVLTLVAVAGQGAFNWLYFGTYVLWPLALSLWASPELVLPLLFAIASPVYFAVSAGVGRQRLIVAQRDAARNTQLLQANRLAALGRLSAGLAHELNQHIFSVRGFAQRLRRDSAERLGPGLDELEMIEQATERMSRVIDNVRRLSRAEKPRHDLIDPSEPLRQALSVVERQLNGHGIQCIGARTPGTRTRSAR